MNTLLSYASGSLTYGFIRGLVRCTDLKHSDGVTDALPAQKFCGILVNTVMAPSLLPIFVYNDANRIYLSLTKTDYKKFGYSEVDTSILQTIFE